MTDWRPDGLGPDWQATTLPLAPDAQGEAVATLVRYAPGVDRRRAILYVHGFIDYFFQTHLGPWAAELGYALYALDLRGYGRSLLPHQLPNYVSDIAEHAREIDAAMSVVRADHGPVVLMGHSTGGLIAALWAHARRDRPGGPAADALVLNSPWLELNRGWFDREVSSRVAALVAPVAPRLVVGHTAPFYGQWLHDPAGGGWDYDQAWKPDAGFPVRAAWLASVRRGHRAVARGLDVDVPVLVCASEATGPADRHHDALGSTDSVLAVEHMVDRAPLLGATVDVVQIPGGVHDLALSPEPARTEYLEAVAGWLARRLP